MTNAVLREKRHRYGHVILLGLSADRARTLTLSNSMHPIGNIPRCAGEDWRQCSLGSMLQCSPLIRRSRVRAVVGGRFES